MARRRRRRALSFVAAVAAQLGLFAACTSTTPSSTEPPPVAAAPDGARAADAARAADGSLAETGVVVPEADGAASASDAAEEGVEVQGTDASPSGEDATASQDATTELDASAPEVDAASDAGVGDAGDAVACNALVQLGAPVDALRTTAPHPILDGGTLASGTYVLTEVSDFVEVPPSNVPFPYGSGTLRIDGLHVEELFTYPAGDVRRFAATLHVDGASLTMTTSCVESAVPHYPALGDWAPLEQAYLSTTFQATPTTLVVWTPRGNHESLTLVYERIGD